MTDYKLYIPHIKQWEGGISRRKSDLASKNPCPYEWPDPEDGEIYSDWHTNKGITWSTYTTHAPKFGVDITMPENFFEMSEDVWEYIFKKAYWDAVGGDNIKSQACANAFVQWAWGSGVTGSLNLLNRYLTGKGFDPVTKWSNGTVHINSLISSLGEKAVFQQICDIRETKLREAAIKSPKNLKGWLNRLADFKLFNKQFLGD